VKKHKSKIILKTPTPNQGRIFVLESITIPHLRIIFEPKWYVVTGEWRKLHNEELHNLYSYPIIRQITSRGMRLNGHVARIGVERKVYKVLVGKPEGKRPLGRPRLRWEDGIRMDLKVSGWGMWIGFDWLRIGTGGEIL
jgi:hypothetical protein